jgi:hypothetical protein
MCKDFYFQELAIGATNISGLDFLNDTPYLRQGKFSGKYNKIGECCIECHGVYISYIGLRADMQPHALFPAFIDYGKVGGDYGIYSGKLAGGYDLSYQLPVVIIHGGIECEV